MKKILISIIICLMMLTLNVNAATTKDKINVYFFHGDGCPHCENATKFFDSIKKEYEKYYNLEKYEVWYNEENSNLMEKFRRRLGDDPEGGVPYIIVGKKSFSGFDDSIGEQIKEAIENEYNKSKRYDVMTAKDDNTVGIIVLVGLVLVGIGICYLRLKNNEE